MKRIRELPQLENACPEKSRGHFFAREQWAADALPWLMLEDEGLKFPGNADGARAQGELARAPARGGSSWPPQSGLCDAHGDGLVAVGPYDGRHREWPRWSRRSRAATWRETPYSIQTREPSTPAACWPSGRAPTTCAFPAAAPATATTTPWPSRSSPR